jgi:hypothetical protein
LILAATDTNRTTAVRYRTALISTGKVPPGIPLIGIAPALPQPNPHGARERAPAEK